MDAVPHIRNKAYSRVQPARRPFLQNKINRWLTTVFVTLLAMVFGYLMATNLTFGLGLFGGLFGIFVIITCISNPRVGFFILVFFSFFINYFIALAAAFGKMSPNAIPVGLFFDILVSTTFIGTIINRSDFKRNMNQFTKQLLVIFILFALCFSCIQFFNPNSPSTTDNIQAVRKYIGYVLVMFLAYTLFDTYARARQFLKFLFFVAVISALYGCKQKMFGFFNYELQLLMSDPIGWGLIFNSGDIRISSTMSDPASFGIAMAVCSLFFLILATHETNKVIKWTLLIGSMIMITAMGYSGTRTAYAILVAGVGFFIMLNFDKKSTRIFALISIPILLFILYAPIYGNNTIQRFRTTFTGSEDQSYKVRVLSRAFIQPYIRSHPIGGGLGTTGNEGVRNHPGHYLANFQPDSGYVKRAAETGWSGLLVICILYSIALITGIKEFFKTRNDHIRVIAAACASSLYAFYIAEFPQQAIGQMTDVVIYYPILAMILRMRKYDSEFTAQVNNPESVTVSN